MAGRAAAVLAGQKRHEGEAALLCGELDALREDGRQLQAAVGRAAGVLAAGSAARARLERERDEAEAEAARARAAASEHRATAAAAAAALRREQARRAEAEAELAREREQKGSLLGSLAERESASRMLSRPA